MSVYVAGRSSVEQMPASEVVDMEFVSRAYPPTPPSHHHLQYQLAWYVYQYRDGISTVPLCLIRVSVPVLIRYRYCLDTVPEPLRYIYIYIYVYI